VTLTSCKATRDGNRQEALLMFGRRRLVVFPWFS
jgi:hypothetical protein